MSHRQPGNELKFRSEETWLLRDGSYRWVVIKSFDRPDDLSNLDCVASLMRHKRYRDHYCGPQDQWEPTEGIHGPYRLELLDVDSFEPDSEDVALGQVKRRVWEYERTESADLINAEQAARRGCLKDGCVATATHAIRCDRYCPSRQTDSP